MTKLLFVLLLIVTNIHWTFVLREFDNDIDPEPDMRCYTSTKYLNTSSFLYEDDTSDDYTIELCNNEFERNIRCFTVSVTYKVGQLKKTGKERGCMSAVVIMRWIHNIPDINGIYPSNINFTMCPRKLCNR